MCCYNKYSPKKLHNMSQFRATQTPQTTREKIQMISTNINGEIVRWYIRSGLKKDLDEFRPGFIDEEEYIIFMECFEILEKNQTDIKDSDELLYNFIIYYYLLVVVECYVLDYSYDFKMFTNKNIQKWLYLFSINECHWASDIRRKLLNFNTEKFHTFHMLKFDPFKNIDEFALCS